MTNLITHIDKCLLKQKQKYKQTKKNTCEAGTIFGLKRHNVENVAF